MAWKFVKEREAGFIDEAIGAVGGFVGGAGDIGESMQGGNFQRTKALEEQNFNQNLAQLSDEELLELGLSEEEIQQLRNASPVMQSFMGEIDQATGGTLVTPSFGRGAGQTAGELFGILTGSPAGGAVAEALGMPKIAQRLGGPMGGYDTPISGVLQEAGLFGAGSEAAKQMELGPVGELAVGGVAAASPSIAKGIKGAAEGLGARGQEAVKAVGLTARKTKDIVAERMAQKEAAEAERQALQKAEQEGKRAFETAKQAYQEESEAVKQTIQENRLNKKANKLDVAKAQEEIGQISQNALSTYESKMAQNTKNVLENIEGKTVDQIEKELVQDTYNSLIGRIAPVESAENSMKLVADAIEEKYQAQKSKYTPLYEAVEQAAKNIPSKNVKPLQAEARKVARKLDKLNVKAEGGQKVIDTLKKAVMDLANPNLTVGEQLQLARNISSIVNFESTLPELKNILIPFERKIRAHAKEQLRTANSFAFKKLQIADKMYKDTIETFGNDFVVRLRKSDTPESTLSGNLQGSNLRATKKALGDSPYSEYLDAEIVRQLSRKSPEGARDVLREINSLLSPEARDVAQEISKMGNKLTSTGAENAMLEKVLGDVQQMANFGSRPDYTLKLMDTPKGEAFLNRVLGKSAQGRKVFEQLQIQKGMDVLSSIFKNGELNLPTLNAALKDPRTRKQIANAYGESGVSWLRNLNEKTRRLENNIVELNQTNQTIDSIVLSQEQKLAQMQKPRQNDYLSEELMTKIDQMNASDAVKKTAGDTIYPYVISLLPTKTLRVFATAASRSPEMIMEAIEITSQLLRDPELRAAVNKIFEKPNMKTTVNFAEELIDISRKYLATKED